LDHSSSSVTKEEGFMKDSARESIVVITGASSGIGRATALAFAGKGSGVVLAARREEVLREVAAECERLGGRALVVPTDTSDEAAVESLARQAVEHFGRIDVWVNNAAVGLYARFEDAPAADYRRVIEVNLFGYIHGARAALPRFYRQGHGVLINNASVMGTVPAPYASAYVVSKHGVRALGDSLRQEILLAGADRVHVCTVLPATIDTPFFRHAGNYTGRAVKAMPPVYAPEAVADAIVRLAENPAREVVVGNAGRMMELGQTLSKGMSEQALAVMVDKQHLANEPAPPTSGNLFSAMDEGSGVTDGWDGVSLERGRLATAPGIGKVAAALLVAVPAAFAWRRSRQGSANGQEAGVEGRAEQPATKAGPGPKDKKDLVVAWLDDAYAMENALVRVLDHRIRDARDYPWVRAKDEQHLEETRLHAELVRGCLERLGAQPSALKSMAGTVFGAIQAPMTGMARDEIVKNFLVDHAAERFEVASYRALVAAAEEIGDVETAAVCSRILAEDEAMADWIVDNTPRIVRERMNELAGSAG
jgi:short-subunit dehydrogenase/ferritin-like metal-binding protein YciE